MLVIACRQKGGLKHYLGLAEQVAEGCFRGLPGRFISLSRGDLFRSVLAV